MRRKFTVVLSGLLLVGALGVPAAAVASDAQHQRSAAAEAGRRRQRCAAAMHAAVVEDNEAYAAKDAARYEAILNPRMIFWYDGATTYGRDAIMETARANFAVPGWEWTWSIVSETIHGCDSGIVVLDAHTLRPAPGIDRHFSATMYMVREHGKWTVGADNVHLLPS